MGSGDETTRPFSRERVGSGPVFVLFPYDVPFCVISIVDEHVFEIFISHCFASRKVASVVWVHVSAQARCLYSQSTPGT